MPVQGTWGIGNYKLKDYGFTELLRELAGKRPSAEVTTMFNNPEVYRSQGISTAPIQDNSVATVPQDQPTRTPYAAPGGSTADASRDTGGGGGVDEVALAEAARRNRINSYKAQAGNIRNEAENTFANILKAVNAFRDRSGKLRDSAGQEIINRSSEILGSNARTGREAEGAARARGRAFGLGDSSKFNVQNRVAGNLAATQGSTLARKGEEERSNQNLFQERQDQAQSQEDEANTYLRSARDRATTIENTGYDAGEEVFGNALNDIVNYQRQLAALKPVDASGISAYNPDFSGIANTINGVLEGMGQEDGATQEANFANPVNPTDIFSLLKRRGLATG